MSGAWLLVVGIAAYAILCGVSYLYDKIESLREKRQKCSHGVPGAYRNPNLCIKCREAAAEQVRQRQAAAAAAQAAIEQQRAREAALRQAENQRRLAKTREELRRNFRDYRTQTAREQAEREAAKKAREEEAARRLAAEEKGRKEAQALRQKQYEEHLKRIRLPRYLSSMNPLSFEKLVLETYRRRGWHVTPTPASGDGGVDGFLRKDGRLWVLQCKRVKGKVGEPVLRDLRGTMIKHNADHAVVVTTGKVSRQARTWIRDQPIEVIELKAITEMVRETFPEHEVVPDGWQP